MSCPAIVLSGLTAQRYQSLLATAHAQGLELSGLGGVTEYQGMTFTWAYDPDAQDAPTLTIQCTEKPFFVPCSLIEQKIRALISSD